MPQPNLRRRSARVRPYLMHLAPPPAVPSLPLPLLERVRDGLRALPERSTPAASPGPATEEHRTPLVRLIDEQRARTAADRAPTEEIPVITTATAAQGVSWR